MHDKKQFRTLEVKVSMVSLKWGDALSTLLPGALALLALSSWVSALAARLKNVETIGVGGGFVLLIAAALLGGVLEALTRISWEKFLVWKHPSCDALSRLDKDNLELYERGVQSSYKYVTFYANCAWATILLLFGQVHGGVNLFSWQILLLLTIVLILFLASYVQWTYFVNYQKKVFGREDAQQRSAVGNPGSVPPKLP
jgi:hypothetical protein